MLVSVIVLINLLIAMMSDTYHNIQSQSDIEWKYGLSKLVRKMQKTKTAPSPLNLVTTWVAFLKRVCKRKHIARQTTDRSHGYMEPTMHQNDFPKSTNNRILPVSRTKGNVNFSLLQSSPADSQWSLNNAPRIQNVVDWDIVRRKYRVRFGDEVEKPSDGGETTLAAMA
ncbi:short transient receptor potential channel 7 [Harpegnathos saltator]|uniref:short transient receptor potential channel 7 n=1 Tax=Harpegnathos saltator TaxID=610380 RepID=UPI000DBEF196|nr:short transient receptor potential channel 7 [Harpegnathos saltator]